MEEQQDVRLLFSFAIFALGLNDVDEIFIAENGTLTVKEFIMKYESEVVDTGGIASCNRWTIGTGGVRGLNKWQNTCDLWPASQKVIVRPENVDYFCAHRIMLGRAEFRPPNGALVNGHHGRAQQRGKIGFGFQ
jgi:hypothetical protein